MQAYSRRNVLADLGDSVLFLESPIYRENEMVGLTLCVLINDEVCFFQTGWTKLLI